MDHPATFIVDTEQKRQACVRTILRLPLDEKGRPGVWDVTIKPWRAKRSLQANKRLWALHKLAAEHTGHSVDEMHDFCCRKFLPAGLIKVGGEEIEVAGRSSKLNTKEFAEFMEQCEAFYISELGVFLGE